MWSAEGALTFQSRAHFKGGSEQGGLMGCFSFHCDWKDGTVGKG